MALQTINDAEAGNSVRAKLNAMFGETYGTGAGDAILQRLKKAAAGVHSVRRTTSQPLNVAPAWAISTVYQYGQRVTNAAKVYVCTTAGTSGSGASPLTVTTPGQIADNTAIWEYVGPSFTADPAAPTITDSSTAPTSGRVYAKAGDGNAYAGLTAIKNNGWRDEWGPYAGASPLDATFLSGGGASGISFTCDDASFTIKQAASTLYASGMSIEVDGRLVSDGMLFPAASGTVYRTIAFATKAARRVAIRFGSHENSPVQAIFCSATGNIYQPQKRAGDLKALFLADSFGGGGSITATYGIHSTCFEEMGIEKATLDGIGGTGFTAGGGNTYGSAGRIANITAYNPDLICAMNSVNDGGATQSAYTTALNAWIASVRAAVGPTKHIFVFGCCSQTATQNVDVWAQAAITALADPNVRFIPASNDSAGPWLTTDSYSTFIGPDNLHPNFRGSSYFGFRMGRAARNVLLALP